MHMDRRRYERASFFCRLSLAPDGAGPMFEAHSTDISLGGVGLVTSGQLSLGQLVAVTFHLADSRQPGPPNAVTGRVVNVRADMDGNRIGVEFLAPLDEKRFPALVRRISSL